MENKEMYEHPALEVVLLENCDIITTSGNDIGEDSGENDGEWM